MMDKDMAEVLRVAGAIIEHELIIASEVKIPGFGKFYTTEIKVSGKRFGKDTGEGDKTTKVVRFKPFTQLKTNVNDQEKEATLVTIPNTEFLHKVEQKLGEGEPDRNAPEITAGDPEPTMTATTETSKVEINGVDVTEHVKDVSVEVKESTTVKVVEEKPVKKPAGGLLGGFGGGGGALFGK